MAVIPAAHGRGVANALLRALLAIGNEPARRRYESLGFQLYITYVAAYFGGAFPGTIKYRLPLV